MGLKPLQPCPVRGPGIDMQQVQCLVEEMGTSLSPGAQNLMDMVHFQQQVGLINDDISQTHHMLLMQTQVTSVWDVNM